MSESPAAPPDPTVGSTVPPVLGSTVYLTTKQVASLFGVCQRTVATWFDTGVIKGFRLPGHHGDRRYQLASCIALATKHEIPIDLTTIPPRRSS